MDSLKGALSKGLTTLNVKTNNFMEESKYKTYISTLEKEIKDLKLELGEVVYEGWKNSTDVQEKIVEIAQNIKAKEDGIEQQKEAIKRLAVEEQQILGTKNTNNNAAQQPNASEQIIFCPKCGAQSSQGFKFCTKCGSPLN